MPAQRPAVVGVAVGQLPHAGVVAGAAALVAWTGSLWPDLLVGVAIAALFLRPAASVLREALAIATSTPGFQYY